MTEERDYKPPYRRVAPHEDCMAHTCMNRITTGVPCADTCRLADRQQPDDNAPYEQVQSDD